MPLKVSPTLRKSLSIQALGTADLSKVWVHELTASLLETVQLVGLVSAPCTLFFSPGIKTALTSQETLSQNKIRKLCWPQFVPVPPLYATLPDVLMELGMFYSLPMRM